MTVKTRGIVLAQTPLSSQDKKLTLLTSDLGMVEAVARGVSGAKSRMYAAAEVLAYSDFCLFKGKNHYIIDSADLERNFYKLRSDLVSLSLAGYFCELTRYILPAEDISESCLKLLLNTLHLLENQKRSPAFLKAVFELRLLCLAGFTPDFSDCARCGHDEVEVFVFLPLEGRLICASCLADTPYRHIQIPLHPSVLAALRHITAAEDRAIYSFRLSPDSEASLGEATEAFALCHAGGRFKSLDFYKHMLDPLIDQL